MSAAPGTVRGFIAVERWLAAKVGIDGHELFAGITSPETRSARIRAVILERGLADEIAGHRHGRAQTYAEVFAVVYERPLSHPSPLHPTEGSNSHG